MPMTQTRLKLSEIKFGDRVRKDLGKIDGLARSMDFLGLINPVTVDNNHVLLAGARRIEAARQLGWDTIPTRVLEVPPGITREEFRQKVEIDENAQRKGFSKAEQAEIKTLLEHWGVKARERQKQSPGRPSKNSASRDAEFSGADKKQRTARRAAQDVAEVIGQSPTAVERFASVLRTSEDSSDPEVQQVALDQLEKLDKGEATAWSASKAVAKVKKEEKVPPLKKKSSSPKRMAPKEQVALVDKFVNNLSVGSVLDHICEYVDRELVPDRETKVESLKESRGLITKAIRWLEGK